MSVRGRELCIGCFIGYPAALATILGLLLLSMFFQMSYLWIYLASVTLVGLNLLRKAMGTSTGARVFFRALLGIALGLILYALFTAPLNDEKLLMGGIALGAIVSYIILKGRSFFQTCRECEGWDRFPDCEGLRKKDGTQADGSHRARRRERGGQERNSSLPNTRNTRASNPKTME